MSEEVKDVSPKKDKKAKVEKPKVEKSKVLTIAGVFQTEAAKGAPTRKELAQRIISTLKEAGQTKNVRGHEIREDRVLQQISAMLRDINNERGKKTDSWWSKFKVQEGDKEIRIVPL